MKKVKYLLGLGLTLVLVTGCGDKKSTVVCTQTTQGVDVTFNVNFLGNLVETMDLRYDMDLSDYDDKVIAKLEEQDFCASVKAEMGEYKDSFTNCKQSIVDKKLKITADFDVDKFTDSVLDRLGSPEDAKSDLEESGYKCEIKEK